MEFNFYADPEAAYIVLNDTKHRDNSIMVFPWEAIQNTEITMVLGLLEARVLRVRILMRLRSEFIWWKSFNVKRRRIEMFFIVMKEFRVEKHLC